MAGGRALYGFERQPRESAATHAACARDFPFQTVQSEPGSKSTGSAPPFL